MPKSTIVRTVLMVSNNILDFLNKYSVAKTFFIYAADKVPLKRIIVFLVFNASQIR